MEQEGKLDYVGIVEKAGETSQIRIFKQYCEGLTGLDSFSHAIVLYWLHLRDNPEERKTLRVFPKRHPEAPEVGVFASRSPSRPNPIGLCVVRLCRIDECSLFVKDLDALDGSPVVDIKPYIPRADSVANAQAPRWTQSGPRT